MIDKVVDILFGCRHSRYSFPVTIRGANRRPQAAALTGTYVACLDCGRGFPFDWQQMKGITSSSEPRDEDGIARSLRLDFFPLPQKSREYLLAALAFWASSPIAQSESAVAM